MDDETDGILRIGEVPVIRRRDRIVFNDHAQAIRSAREAAFGEVLAYVLKCHAATPKYEDTRPWMNLEIFLRDRIRDNGATT